MLQLSGMPDEFSEDFRIFAGRKLRFKYNTEIHFQRTSENYFFSVFFKNR